MSRFRTVAALFAGLTVAAGALAFTAGGASALPQDGLVVEYGHDTVGTFGPIAVGNVSAQEVDPEPSDCGDPTDASILFAACDVIPLKIVPPPVTDADDFFVEIGMTWNPAQQVEEAQQAVNDLDIYLYDNHQTAQREDPESSAWTQVASSHNSIQPELIRVFRPELGDYNIVVNNFAGPNTDYTITARIVVGIFTPPFEALAPRFDEHGDAPPDDLSAPPPVDYSADLPAASGGSFVDSIIAAPAAALPQLGDVAVLPDSDFDEFATGSDFPSQLRRKPALDAINAAALIPTRPPKPVGAAVLVFWLVGVPLVLAGSGWFLLLRRRSSRAFG